MIPAMNCLYVIGGFMGSLFLIFGYLGLLLCTRSREFDAKRLLSP